MDGLSEDVGAAETAPAPRRRRSAVLREVRSAPTAVLLAVCLFIGIPATILLTPDQHVSVAGQSLAVGARTPSASLSGPAQLVQIGNTRLDIVPLQVWGPLRPRLTLGPVQRNAAAAAAVDPATNHGVGAEAITTISLAFLRWYGWATLGLLAFALAATLVAAYLRMLVTLRRHSRAHHRPVTVVEIWQRGAGQVRGMATVAVVVTLLGWAGAGGLAYDGAIKGLRDVRSLADLVGTYHLSPSPVGPTVRGFTGAVIGDSRAARVGGPAPAAANDDDVACGRSSDSLAAEVGVLRGSRVLNLACSGASIERGLRGAQVQSGRLLPPQVGLLKQVRGLKFVVVMIGPNDLYWADFLRYCYGVSNCSDNLTQGEFDYRLAAFDQAYGELLEDLNDLPDRPQVVIVTSYDVFGANLSCPQARGPAGVAGLDAANVALLANRNAALNSVLTSGADKYKFSVAQPRLAPLCEPGPDQLGADIQGLTDPFPFHPTGLGMIRIASSVTALLRPDGGN